MKKILLFIVAYSSVNMLFGMNSPEMALLEIERISEFQQLIKLAQKYYHQTSASFFICGYIEETPPISLRVPLSLISQYAPICSFCKKSFQLDNCISISNSPKEICYHIFHTDCLESIFRQRRRSTDNFECPICNKKSFMWPFVQFFLSSATTEQVLVNTENRLNALTSQTQKRVSDFIFDCCQFVASAILTLESINRIGVNDLGFFRWIILTKIFLLYVICMRPQAPFPGGEYREIIPGYHDLSTAFMFQIIFDLLLFVTPIGYLPSWTLYPAVGFAGMIGTTPPFQHLSNIKKSIEQIQEVSSIPPAFSLVENNNDEQMKE